MKNNKLLSNAKRRMQRGFTLIEIMIVLTLLGLIGTFAVTNYMKSQREGYIKSTKILIQQLKTALDDYYRTCNSYPNTGQGLAALISKPADSTCKDYDPNGYINGKKVPQDPWGHDFIYISDDGKKVTLKSLGPDGKEGEGNISLEDIQ
ncbi:MAG: type II secretion system major pseudopilin GspG [Deltaproteobacteria bacterium]|nr:type II secretion system major pseudopilin GspG [Deltaproteobacteria bacterium]